MVIAGTIAARRAVWKGVTGMARRAAAKDAGKKRGGRKYATAADLQAKIDEYFNQCDENCVLYGEAGLARHLGVILATLRKWYDGTDCADLQEAVQLAYLRIQEQVETDPRYQEKGMVTRGIFLQKQPRFGGYQDRIEARQNIAVNVKMGANVDASDFQ